MILIVVKNKGEYLKRLYYFCICIIVGLFFNLSVIYGREVKLHTLHNQLNMPNRLVADKSFLYISNVANVYSDSKRGDGFISKLDKTGKIIESRFIDNLDYPQNMTILHNTLYVIDSDRIKGFNLRTRKQVFNLRINGELHLGDVIAWGDNTLLVSDKQTGIILIVDVKKKSYHTFIAIPSSLGSPHLLASYGDTLYVTTSNAQGRILQIDVKTKNISYLSNLSGKFYDMAFTENGGILVGKVENTQEATRNRDEEDWQSYTTNTQSGLYKITPEGKVFKIDLEEEMKNFSYFIVDSQTLWLLDSQNANLLQIILLKTAT